MGYYTIQYNIPQALVGLFIAFFGSFIIFWIIGVGLHEGNAGFFAAVITFLFGMFYMLIKGRYKQWVNNP